MSVWLLVAIGAFVAVIAAVVGLGAMVPREHSATRAAKYTATPEQVWQLINGPQDWRPDVAKWERLDEKRFVETSKNGQKMPMETVTANAPLLLQTRIIDDGLPFGGTWTWQITAVGRGSQLRITEDGFIRNPVFRFVAHYVLGYHTTMESYLKNLGAKLGEPQVKIEE